MASLNRAELLTIWESAKYIFTQSRLPDVRRKAKAIAISIETTIGQIEQSAEYWEI